MKASILATIGVVTLATSATAVAADPAATPAPATAGGTTAKKADPGDRIVCQEEGETGSLTAKKKICMTVTQWRDKAYRSGQWVEHQSTYNTSPNGR